MAPPRLTQEQAQALVEQHGSQLAAARAYGVPRHTLRYWLDPEPLLARRRHEYWRNPESERARSRERWWNLSGLAFNRRLLQQRRVSALRRMAERNQRSAEEAS